MLERLSNHVKYSVERAVLRGAHFRLLFIALLIGGVSIVGGLTAYYADTGVGNRGEAVWWAFLRMTDPGYLGDDEGLFRRIVSTVLTVAGYVIFMGALIAIMTQWLNQTIQNLQRGFTPIAMNDHILVVGWTNRSAALIREMVLSEERVKRFLHRHGSSKLRIVVLAEDVGPELFQELKDELGPEWDPHQIILRSGSPLRIEHLRRVDFQHASAVIVPGADFAYGGAETTDSRVIKILLSINHNRHPDEPLPLLTTEVRDLRKISVARRAYAGPIEITASDSFISRLIAQTVRHRGLSLVYDELLSQGEGNEIYVRTHAHLLSAHGHLAGQRFQDLATFFPTAIPFGVVRPKGDSFEPILNPPDGFVIEEEDRLAFIAPSYSSCEPSRKSQGRPTTRGPTAPSNDLRPERRVLILGWSHKIPALLKEFDSYGAEFFDIHILSAFPIAKREVEFREYDLQSERLRVAHTEMGYTVPIGLRSVDPTRFDNVVFVAGDWLESGEASDAQTILGYLLLEELLSEADHRPEILVELLDPDNAALFTKADCEVLCSPLILSHILSQVALRRELRSVYDELFGPGGAEVFFRPSGHYGQSTGGVAFGRIQEAAAARGEIALGVRLNEAPENPCGAVRLNPDPNSVLHLTEEDEVIVLSTYADSDTPR